MKETNSFGKCFVVAPSDILKHEEGHDHIITVIIGDCAHHTFIFGDAELVKSSR